MTECEGCAIEGDLTVCDTCKRSLCDMCMSPGSTLCHGCEDDAASDEDASQRVREEDGDE